MCVHQRGWCSFLSSISFSCFPDQNSIKTPCVDTMTLITNQQTKLSVLFSSVCVPSFPPASSSPCRASTSLRQAARRSWRVRPSVGPPAQRQASDRLHYHYINRPHPMPPTDQPHTKMPHSDHTHDIAMRRVTPIVRALQMQSGSRPVRSLATNVVRGLGAATESRVEKDTFGDISVRADRYWGAQTQR